MELRHLRYFAALAEELHFGRAAERAFVAQSTLSQQIQTFEAELGTQLFERSRRGVALTEAGETLLPYAQRVLREAERAERVAHAAESGKAGLLRIGYEATAMRSGLPEAIKAFRTEAPGVTLDLDEEGSRAQAEALRNGDLDVGFVFLPVDERGLRVEPLIEAPAVVALPEEHRLAGRDAVPLRELEEEPHVMWARDATPSLYDDYLRACHDAGFAPHVVQEIRYGESLRGLVAAGLGVAVAHPSSTQVQRPGVVYARLTEPQVPLTLGAARPQSTDDAPEAVRERFLRAMRRAEAFANDAASSRAR
jgi:DNA-binding transcriptional LysR family regulator